MTDDRPLPEICAEHDSYAPCLACSRLDATARWHDTRSDTRPLRDVLTMSTEEYARWVERGDSCPYCGERGSYHRGRIVSTDVDILTGVHTIRYCSLD